MSYIYQECIKFQSMNIIQNYHNSHTKFKFGMTIVVILYDPHTLEFAVHRKAGAKERKAIAVLTVVEPYMDCVK